MMRAIGHLIFSILFLPWRMPYWTRPDGHDRIVDRLIRHTPISSISHRIRAQAIHGFLSAPRRAHWGATGTRRSLPTLFARGIYVASIWLPGFNGSNEGTASITRRLTLGSPS